MKQLGYMDIVDHAHAGIISLTQYEQANHHGNMDAARAALLETMGHIVAITKLTPAAPDYRPPSDLGRPERVCRYLRALDYLASVLPIPNTNIRHYNHIALAWLECVALCEYHGWMPPAALTATPPRLAQLEPVPLPVAARPLLPRR